MSDSTLLESTEIPAPKRSWIWFALTSGLVLIFLVSLFLGRYPQAGLVRLAQLQENELARLLVFNVRLPRLLTALLLGMVMASAGTNPNALIERMQDMSPEQVDRLLNSI